MPTTMEDGAWTRHWVPWRAGSCQPRKTMSFGCYKEVHSAEFASIRRRSKWKLIWYRGKNGPVAVPWRCLLRAWNRSHGYGEVTRGKPTSLGRVVRDMSQEERCQTRSALCGRGPCGVPSGWLANNGGKGSARAFRYEQTQRRKRRGMEVQPFRETAGSRRSCVGSTWKPRKVKKRELKRGKEALVLSGGELYTEGLLSEDVHRDDGTG